MAQSDLRWRDNDPKVPTVDKHLQSVDVQKLIFQLRAGSVKDTSFLKDWDSGGPVWAFPAISTPNFIRGNGSFSGNGDRFRRDREFAFAWLSGELRARGSGIDPLCFIGDQLVFLLLFLTLAPLSSSDGEHRSPMGATFRPGATFRNYLGHLKKACFLTGTTIERYTPAVRDAPKGLRCALRRPFKFPNFIYTHDLFRIINGLCCEDRFALIAFASFLFSLRVSSEALCLRRARPDDRLAEFVPQGEKVLIGAHRSGGDDCLII